MRKTTALLGAVALLSIFPATPALAAGTIVIGDGTCNGFVPTVTGGVGAFLSGGEIHVVTKQNWTTITCHLDIPDGLEPPKGVRAYNVPCLTELGTTTDTRMSASPGGRAVGTCRLRNVE